MNIKQRIKSLLTKKYRGDGELITNAFTIFIIAVMLIFFIGLYNDMKFKDNMDLVGRKYILIMETTNTLDVDDILVDIDRATGGDGTGQFKNWAETPKVIVTVDGSDGSSTERVTSGTYEIPAEYGDTITLTITGDMKIKTGRWVTLGNVSGNKTANLIISKSSTSKH